LGLARLGEVVIGRGFVKSKGFGRRARRREKSAAVDERHTVLNESDEISSSAQRVRRTMNSGRQKLSNNNNGEKRSEEREGKVKRQEKISNSLHNKRHKSECERDSCPLPPTTLPPHWLLHLASHPLSASLLSLASIPRLAR